MEKSKTQTAIEFRKANPDVKIDEFLKMTGLSRKDFHNATYRIKVDAEKKGGLKKAKPIALGSVTGTRVSADIAALQRAHKRIAELENDNRSLRVVISYLEHQLGMKQSAASV